MGSRRFLLITIPLFLILLWIISGLSRSSGLMLFLAGVCSLSLCCIAFLQGRRRPLYLLYFSGALVALLIGLTEATLRIAPQLLKGKAAVSAFNGYHSGAGGIYENDPHIGYTLRKNYSQRIYWNGHWWNHQTNAEGYRGALIEQPEAVFLGDSMIYGHGVENGDTVASRFAYESGLKTVNLGQQGTSLIQMWLRYRQFAKKWKPRYVFVCSHSNDVWDASYWYPLNELKLFIQATTEQREYLPKVKKKYWSDSLAFQTRHFWNQHLQINLRTTGALRALRRLFKKSDPLPTHSVIASKSKHYLPGDSERVSPFTPWAETASPQEQLGWQAHVAALKEIKKLCEEQGAELVLFDLGFSADFCKSIERLAQEVNALYVPAGSVAMQRAFEGEEVYLQNDGHWTGTGAQIIAQTLIQSIRTQTVSHQQDR